MFKEITDMPTIMELGAAGMLWDSWWLRDSDTTNTTFGEYIWDEPQPIAAADWDRAVYKRDLDEESPDGKYRFYVWLEE